MPIDTTRYGDTVARKFRINRKDIWYLHFIFEAYDGVGTVSTVDARNGVIEIHIPSSRDEEASQLIRELSREISLMPLSPG